MTTAERELCRLLIDCLTTRGPDVEAPRLSRLPPERWLALQALATTQRVLPLLWHRLRQQGLDKTMPVKTAEAFREAYRHNTVHNLLYVQELQAVLAILNAENIPMILLKGMALAPSAYGALGLRAPRQSP